ncbi:MAG TPA: hypothetical protein DCR35_16305 [Runella sp.]|nr:hypothetical protein [Runella sp.]HAO50720.1 hypothetical protein [Runella sp.]
MQSYLKNSLTFFAFTLVYFLGFNTIAQDKSTRPSPPAQVSREVGGITINLNYGQPSVKGRKVWGELVPYGQVWRAGANEATTFEIDKDATIEGATLPAGKYGFFAIPSEGKWTLIFNKVAAQWGAFKYDEKQDALRVSVQPKKSSQFNEKLLYTISPKGKVSLLWENVEVAFSVNQ